jgi:hypothetical protein
MAAAAATSSVFSPPDNEEELRPKPAHGSPPERIVPSPGTPKIEFLDARDNAIATVFKPRRVGTGYLVVTFDRPPPGQTPRPPQIPPLSAFS